MKQPTARATPARSNADCLEYLQERNVVQAVLMASKDLKGDALVIHGHDFNTGSSLDAILSSMLTTGCQASHLGKAIAEVNRMVRSSRNYHFYSKNMTTDVVEMAFE